MARLVVCSADMNARQPYSTDVSDGQWSVIEPLAPPSRPGGRPPKYPRREIVNAILYALRSGCGWALMPHDLPKAKTAYHCFRLWRIDGTWKAIHDELRGDPSRGERQSGDLFRRALDTHASLA